MLNNAADETAFGTGQGAEEDGGYGDYAAYDTQEAGYDDGGYASAGYEAVYGDHEYKGYEGYGDDYADNDATYTIPSGYAAEHDTGYNNNYNYDTYSSTPRI